MTTPTDATTSEMRAKIVPPARSQTGLAVADLLHSGNAGVVVSKVGQAHSEYRNEARMFARELAKHVNKRQAGNATLSCCRCTGTRMAPIADSRWRRTRPISPSPPC
ncbi:MAG TPA: DUF6039 family protein [Streptosporangiaceae bacterium]|nr:DUF6039 family protein [Streptosporangiaceae bacterium]